MKNSLVNLKGPEEKFLTQANASADQRNLHYAKGIEILLGLVFITLALWLGIQGWRNPLVFDWPMLVVSEAALVGGPLWLWLILQD